MTKASMTGAQFKQWRKDNKWTQDEVADYFGISKRQVRNYEKEEYPVTKMIHFAMIGLQRYLENQKK